MILKDQLANVADRATLAAFINAMKDDLGKHPDDWENADLASFLEAMAGWVEDMDGYYKNIGVDFDGTPSWRLFAETLLAARQYE